MAGFPGWRKQLLRTIGAPVTQSNLKALDAWQRAEGGSAAFNPLNTTQHAPGASSYNTVGVRNFVSPQQGVRATAETLLNGRYGPIVSGLRSGADPVSIARAVEQSPWGTGGGVLRVLGAPSTRQNTSAPQRSVVVTPPPSSIRSSKVDAAAQIMANMGDIASGRVSPLDSLTALNEALRPGFESVTTSPTKMAVAAQGGQSRTSAGIAKTALSQIGIPYQWGGPAKLGQRTDCSGLLQASARANGVSIGRTTYEQWKQGTPVALNKLMPGDAVFFHPGPQGPEHVGIYVGNGRIVEDPHTGSSVHVSSLAGRGAIGARRYL